MKVTKTLLLSAAWLFSAGLGGTLAVLFGAHLYLSPSLPSVERLRDVKLQTPLRIYSSDGLLIGEMGEKRRTPIQYSDIPQGYIDALLSAEDAQFYSHKGVSIKGLLRAASQLLISGDIQGGGSTITMQVARHFFLSKRQEFKRKFNEILLALRIERELSKEEILELYVNMIFMGNRAYGIEAAAQVYYGKTLNELSVAQLAMLAGLPKAPSTMNPIANPVRATERRNWILGRMLELNKIDQTTHDLAITEPVAVSYHQHALDMDAPYAAEIARQFAIDLLGNKAYTDGYQVVTTVNGEYQQFARHALTQGLLNYDRRHGYRGPEQQFPPPAELAKALISKTDPKPIEQVRDEAGEEEADIPNENAQAGEEENANAPLPSQSSWISLDETLQPSYQAWMEKSLESLQGMVSFGDLLPAVVAHISPKTLIVVTQEGIERRIDWENGLEDAVRYVNADRVSGKPETAFDIAKLGDVVRVRLDENHIAHFQQIPAAQGAIVSLNADDGAILSLVGGFDFRQSNFNRATQAKRQPGSSFKPFIYAAALENGYTAASIINDAPIVFEDAQLESTWRPENDSGKFYGPTRLREALYRSRNLVSIRLLRQMGIGTAIRSIEAFGVKTESLPRDLSLALGAHSMTPIDVAAGFALFANGGYLVEPYLIAKIIDVDGEVVYEAKPFTVCRACEDPEPAIPDENDLAFVETESQEASEEQSMDTLAEAPAILDEEEVVDEPPPAAPRTISAEVAYIMDSILKDAVLRGTATKARSLNRPDAAGKTGTSNDFSNAWFSGYAGGIVTTTWVGFDDDSSLGNLEYGGRAALPIWIDFMEDALKEREVRVMPRPSGLASVRINPENGLRTRPDNPNGIFEYFRADTLPEFEDAGVTPVFGETNTSDNVRPDDIF